MEQTENFIIKTASVKVGLKDARHIKSILNNAS